MGDPLINASFRAIHSLLVAIEERRFSIYRRLVFELDVLYRSCVPLIR